ncbi:MAG: hypothetical protein HQL52_14435 [Magnetococcales bacterium]|nr:hypothetical protein [Magnetococcales bacterium]
MAETGKTKGAETVKPSDGGSGKDKMAESGNTKRVDAILEEIKTNLKPGLSEDVQLGLGQLVGTMHSLKKSDNSVLIGAAEVASKGLLQDPPNTKMADTILVSIQQTMVYTLGPLRKRLSKYSKPLRAIFGLTASLFLVYIVLLLVRHATFTDGYWTQEGWVYLVVGMSGSVGAVTSVLVRIREIVASEDADPLTPFLTGFVKPLIGLSFAVFVAFAIQSQVIPITPPELVNSSAVTQPASSSDSMEPVNLPSPKKSDPINFYIAISFVVGFSERFARDLISKVESTHTK